MKTLTLNEVRKIYVEDYKKRPNNKSSNEPLIKLIDIINKPNATISIIEGKQGLISRGVVAECLIKMLVLKLDKSEWSAKGADFEYLGKQFEVKYSSAKGYAHYNPKQCMENLIFMDREGIYLTNGSNIVLDKCQKHIQTINKANATMLVHLA